MLFKRPAIQELIAGFTYIIKKGYSGRGEA